MRTKLNDGDIQFIISIIVVPLEAIMMLQGLHDVVEMWLGDKLNILLGFPT